MGYPDYSSLLYHSCAVENFKKERSPSYVYTLSTSALRACTPASASIRKFHITTTLTSRTGLPSCFTRGDLGCGLSAMYEDPISSHICSYRCLSRSTGKRCLTVISIPRSQFQKSRLACADSFLYMSIANMTSKECSDVLIFEALYSSHTSITSTNTMKKPNTLQSTLVRKPKLASS